MALQKSVSCACDVAGQYLKIVQVNYDGLRKRSNLTLAIYKDKAARDAGKEPIERRSYSIDKESLADLYTALKEMPDYSGALDV